MSGKTRILDVQFLDNYIMDIRLSNGHRILFNMKPKLSTARFAHIHSIQHFNEGKVIDGKLVRWNPITELSLNEMLLNLEKEKTDK